MANFKIDDNGDGWIRYDGEWHKLPSDPTTMTMEDSFKIVDLSSKDFEAYVRWLREQHG